MLCEQVLQILRWLWLLCFIGLILCRISSSSSSSGRPLQFFTFCFRLSRSFCFRVRFCLHNCICFRFGFCNRFSFCSFLGFDFFFHTSFRSGDSSQLILSSFLCQIFRAIVKRDQPIMKALYIFCGEHGGVARSVWGLDYSAITRSSWFRE